MREGAPYYPALQATCGFEKGECFAVVFKPTGLLSRTAEWFVVDVADQAVVLRGKAPLSELEAMQPIEMDVDALRRFVAYRATDLEAHTALGCTVAAIHHDT
ncbi:hypothetical protein EMIHUDRAFT_254830 [Emiliania huxleyi CCMP1516]|uniref:Uncharacterized protein n=2 Tax=Emiliania huxleyi TaxID=2903 RepID=A0A0D3JKZ9_EMIH1|nr:hypothetical protein EMIHUDRAFT_254830 [Emiliania huxleyi CCMP1516]EOD24184.1 hypothetical protein EMIHUDRAFT_254830 [Emiliania huxleyi CCMP1516]|eukprot:XP_005776613.1 hypothetical protein EMIHUDRAFT_254830 [Emiliania huxleyi CCMP1516]